MGVFQRLLRVLHCVESTLLVLTFLGLLGLSVAQIIARNVFGEGFLWAEQLMRLLILWLSLLGAMVAARHGEHLKIDLIQRFAPPHLACRIVGVMHGLCAVICTAAAYACGRFISWEQLDGTLLLDTLPLWQVQLILPVAFAVLAGRYLLAVFIPFKDSGT